MEIEEPYIRYFKQQFSSIFHKRQIVQLLNTARYLRKGESPYFKSPMDLFTYYAHPHFCKHRYHTFSIKKKSGGQRLIHAPTTELKSILRDLNLVLQCAGKHHTAATAYVPGSSIYANAVRHVGNRYILNVDLLNFFHSFDRNQVKLGFMRSPYNFKEKIAFLLASLCTHPIEIDGKTEIVLPQGSPTSPTLSNILCQTLDRRLNGLANRFGAVYTRYADDMTFSSSYNIAKNTTFANELTRIINDQGFEINSKKTRIQKSNYRQEVTGLVVNDKVNVRRRYVKDLRKWLYLWETYGKEKAELYFRQHYVSDKGHVKKGNISIENVISGKLEYLKSIKGSTNEMYLLLKSRFDKLADTAVSLNSILHLWERDGIDSAMKAYYNMPRNAKDQI